MITDNCEFSGNISMLVWRIRKFLNLSWTVQINHTLREGNRSAVWLANFSISMDSMNFNLLETPPNELQSLLFTDLFGACMSKNVILVCFFFPWALPSFVTKKKAVDEIRGVRGPVWIGFETKSQPIQNKNHVWFGSVWMIILKKSDPNRSKYMRFNLDRFLDIQSATCNFFININITNTQ
jgi:hypothetical protein